MATAYDETRTEKDCGSRPARAGKGPGVPTGSGGGGGTDPGAAAAQKFKRNCGVS